jgi:hypothetical protein
MLEDDEDDDQQAGEDQEQPHGRVQVPVYRRPEYQNDDTPDERQYEDTPQYQSTPQYPAAPQYQDKPHNPNAPIYQNAPQQQNPAPIQNQGEQGTIQQGKLSAIPIPISIRIHVWFDLTNMIPQASHPNQRRKRIKPIGTISAMNASTSSRCPSLAPILRGINNSS